MKWEKIFANDATGKGFIPKIYNQLIQLNIKKTIKKWAEHMNRHFLQRRYTDDQQAHDA